MGSVLTSFSYFSKLLWLAKKNQVFMDAPSADYEDRTSDEDIKDDLVREAYRN